MASIWEYLRGERNTLDPGGQQKVTLTKSTPQHAITGAAATTGYLYVNLHWTTRINAPRASGRDSLRRWFSPRILSPMEPDAQQGAQVNVDLDLACMYELSDGSRGVVQPLGGYFGDLRARPTSSSAGTTSTGRRPARRCT